MNQTSTESAQWARSEPILPATGGRGEGQPPPAPPAAAAAAANHETASTSTTRISSIPIHRGILTAQLISEIPSAHYLELYHPYVKTIKFLRSLGLGTSPSNRTPTEWAIMQSHLFLQRWRNGPVDRMTWRYRWYVLFKRIKRLLPLGPTLVSVGEQIMADMLTHMDTSFHVSSIMHANEHARLLTAVMETDSVRAAWFLAIRQFRQDYRNDSIQAIAPHVAAPSAAPFQDVHIQLTQKDYRSVVTSVTGSISRRSDAKVPNTCAICIENLRERRKWHVLACEHKFHPHCLKTWLMTQCRQPICPLCRFDVRKTRTRPQKR